MERLGGICVLTVKNEVNNVSGCFFFCVFFLRGVDSEHCLDDNPFDGNKGEKKMGGQVKN